MPEEIERNCPSVRPWKEQGAVISAPVCGCCVMNTTVRVPDDFDALTEIARALAEKSANLIMGDVFGKPAIVTDTHCIRLIKPHGTRRRDQGAEKSRDGAVEDSFHRKKAVISATGWWSMEEQSVPQGRSPIVTGVCCRRSVRRSEYDRKNRGGADCRCLFVTVQSQAKFHKTGGKCLHF